MNRITIIGRLCADPELRTIANGTSVCSFRVAVNRRFKKDEADYFSVVIWREAAEASAKYLKKGSQAAVTGALQIRQYEQDGVKRQAVEIQADEVEFLGTRAEETPSQAPRKNKLADLEEVDIGDMPF